MWFLGDNFFRKTFNTFTAMRNQTQLNKVRPPYLFEFYNIFGYCQNTSSMVRGLSRFYNPLIEALNTCIKLSHYIIMVWDKDFIWHADTSNDVNGTTHIYAKLIERIIMKMENIIH